MQENFPWVSPRVVAVLMSLDANYLKAMGTMHLWQPVRLHDFRYLSLMKLKLCLPVVPINDTVAEHSMQRLDSCPSNKVFQ